MADIHEFTKGWSVARLADEFGMDRRTASKRLKEAGVPPLTKRAGHDVHRLADAAPALVNPGAAAFGVEGVVDPRDLPPMERRAYYQSENERLKVESTIGAAGAGRRGRGRLRRAGEEGRAVLRHAT